MAAGKTSRTKARTRAYAGASHEERVRERRARLLEAGLEVIGTQGLAAATVRAICRESGLNQRYYYEQFRDAQDLLVQVYTEQLGRLEAEILKSVKPGEPLSEQVRQAANAYFTTVREDSRLGRVVLFEILGVSPEVDAVHRAGSARFEGVVSRLITEAIPAGQAMNWDVELLAQAVVGAMVAVAGNWLLSGYVRRQDEMVDNIAFVFEAVLEKLVPSPS